MALESSQLMIVVHSKVFDPILLWLHEGIDDLMKLEDFGYFQTMHESNNHLNKLDNHQVFKVQTANLVSNIWIINYNQALHNFSMILV